MRLLTVKNYIAPFYYSGLLQSSSWKGV